MYLLIGKLASDVKREGRLKELVGQLIWSETTLKGTFLSRQLLCKRSIVRQKFLPYGLYNQLVRIIFVLFNSRSNFSQRAFDFPYSLINLKKNNL